MTNNKQSRYYNGEAKLELQKLKHFFLNQILQQYQELLTEQQRLAQEQTRETQRLQEEWKRKEEPYELQQEDVQTELEAVDADIDGLRDVVHENAQTEFGMFNS